MIQINVEKWSEFDLPLLEIDIDTLTLNQTLNNFDLTNLHNRLNDDQLEYSNLKYNVDNLVQLDIDHFFIKGLNLHIFTVISDPTLDGYRVNDYYNTNRRPELIFLINQNQLVKAYKCYSIYDLLPNYDGIYFGTNNTLMLDINRPDNFSLINFSIKRLNQLMDKCINECQYSDSTLLLMYNFISSNLRNISEANCLLPPFEIVDSSYVEQN